uniref:Uncharacterized protein n=1 Tax=viral metagenome TaxID=1070528 RepID=A0A6C0IA68_9ZZZZ
METHLEQVTQDYKYLVNGGRVTFEIDYKNRYYLTILKDPSIKWYLEQSLQLAESTMKTGLIVMGYRTIMETF